MKTPKHFLLLAMASSGCLVADGERRGAAMEPQFLEGDDGDRIDSAGVPLLSTVAIRTREPVEHDDAPGLSDAYMRDMPNNLLSFAPGGLPWGLQLRRGVLRLNQLWGDDLRAMGYETCVAPGLPDVVDATQLESVTATCLFQRVGGRTVLDIFVKDQLEIDVNQPAGFPNGRRPEHQINNQIVALGLLKMGTPDPFAPGEVVTIDSLQRVAERWGRGEMTTKPTAHPPANDAPFPGTFPYLAQAHPLQPCDLFQAQQSCDGYTLPGGQE